MEENRRGSHEGCDPIDSSRATTVAGHDRRPIGAGSVGGDVTDTADVEAHLRAQPEFYRKIIEAADLIILIAADGTILYASGAIAEPNSVGYSPADVVGRNSLEIIHPDDHDEVVQAIANDLAGVPTTIEARLLKSDQTWMWVELRSRAIDGPDGKPVIVACVRDINGRKLLQEELKASEEFYRSLLHASADLIVVADQSGELRFVSESIEQILGYRPDEVIGKNMFSFIHPEDVPVTAERLRIAGTSSSPLTDLRIRRKDGTWCPCEGTGRLIAGPDGTPLALISTRDVTERKHIDREQSLLAAIVESSEDAIVSNSLDQRIISWNKGAERLFGYTAAEAIGQRASLYMPPEWRAWGEAFLDDLKTRIDHVQSFEVPCLSKNGTRIDAWTVCGAIRDREGVLIGISAIHRDITERKRADKEHALLAALVKSSDDAIISLSLDFQITSWNRGAQRLLGYTVEETLGKQPFDLYVPPGDRELARTLMARDLAAMEENPEPTRQIDVELLRKDGGSIEVTIVGCGIFDSDKKLIGLSTIMHDVTQRRRAEREKALLAAIVNASSDVIITMSPEARIISWNPAAEKAYGYTAEQAMGKSFDLFIPPEELPHAFVVTQQVIETGQPAVWEEHARHPDGSSRISSVITFPIRDDIGKFAAIAGLARDITAIKETERQLIEAREDALAASQSKSEFLSSMSHEIRTPMTAILGMAELLAEGELNTEQRRYIDILANNGHALLELINSILDLAKIESGRMTLEQVDLDLCDVVEKSAQTLAIRAHAKRLELIVSIAPDVPTSLTGDPLRLRQVLINLIGNAIKFTEQGEVLVSVERDAALGEPLRLKFSVRDTGIGIAKDSLPALFAAFSQADSSTSRRYGGSGLGLAIVKRLVNLMNGVVTVNSELGKGSLFAFSAPFEARPDAPGAAALWPNLAHAQVLIVAGNTTERMVLHVMLNRCGADVTEVESYAAGIAAIGQAGTSEHRPRLVLIDDRIGSADSREMEQLISSTSRCGASIIAMIHCDNLAADISRLRSLKLETYLIKPIDLRELAKTIRNLMSDDEGRAPIDHNGTAAIGTTKLLIVDRPLRILFADDSVDNRTLVRAFLKKTPYRLDEVENGRQAIAGFIAAGDYDLVLMDIQMPEVDGYAATRAIREWERDHSHAHTPIIALTASVFPESIRLAREAGCDAHVGKPISKAILLRAIYEAVQGVPILPVDHAA